MVRVDPLARLSEPAEAVDKGSVRGRRGAPLHADVAAWGAHLSASGLAGSTVRYIHRVLALILALAVTDGRLARNPAAGVRLPKAARSEKRYLMHEQVAALAEAAGDRRLLVLVLARTGLRWGELAGLGVRRVDLMRKRIEVAGAVTEVAGHLSWGTPKDRQHRSVPIPRPLVDDLAVHMAGNGPDELVFTSTTRGAVLRNHNFRRGVFDCAARSAGLDGLTPHALMLVCPVVCPDAPVVPITVRETGA